MSWIDAGQHFLRTIVARGRLAREMDEELRFHLELEAMEQGAGAGEGVAERDLARRTRRRFGHVATIREERRRASGLGMFDRVRQDAGYAIRQVTRSPGFAAAVAIIIGLGVGANATMFAIIDRIMLRAPEGIADPEHVVELRSWRELRNGQRDTMVSFSYPSFVEFRAMTAVFERVTAVRGPIDIAVDRGPDAVQLRGALVGDDYFETLGTRPALGRFFDVSETREPAGAPVAVISHGLWQRRYGGDRRVLGRTVSAGGTTYTIVGVAEQGFTGHTLARTDLWLPIAGSPGLRWGSEGWENERRTSWLQVIGRLRPEVSHEEASERIAANWTAWSIRPGNPSRAPTPAFASLVPGRNHDRPEFRVATMLTGVAILLLLITCANVANLLLARALSRRREVAIRLALGVSRARLASLFIMDAVLLALLGAAAALMFARAGVPLVRSILFAGTETVYWAVDTRVATFSVVVAVAAGLMAGIVPAVQASRSALIGALRRTRDDMVQRSATRRALLVAQGALTLSLLAGTGLFVRSLERIGQREPGFDLDRIVVADFEDRGTGYDEELVRRLYLEMVERTRALRGVESASLTVGVPLEGQYALPLELPGHDSIPGMQRGSAPFIYAVTPEFFRTMGTRIIAGRGLLESDDDPNAPAVAVVSASMATLFWPTGTGGSLGQCFRIVLRDATPDCIRVVGVAEDARRESLLGGGDRETVQYYVPLAQAPSLLSNLTLLVRATDAGAAAGALSTMTRTMRADMPYVRVRTLEDAVALEMRPWRVGASVFGLFGALALVVAAVGTFSVIQFGVTQRRHELGVRIALGARGRQVVEMVVGDTLRMIAIAGGAGLLIVLATGRFVESHLFETSARDPAVLGVATAVLVIAAVIASIVPALRATRMDPLTALKAD